MARRLNELMAGLPGGQPRSSGEDGLQGAGRAMQDAGRSLGSGDAETAVGDQGTALDALRRGARQMMQGRGEPGGLANGGTDPLGRPTGRRGADFGDGTRVPGEIEVQRARKLLEELRRRYADQPPGAGARLSPPADRPLLTASTTLPAERSPEAARAASGAKRRQREARKAGATEPPSAIETRKKQPAEPAVDDGADGRYGLASRVKSARHRPFRPSPLSPERWFR